MERNAIRACRVLVADDEYWVRENLRTLLDWRALDLEFLEPAADGEEALRRIAEEKVDLLITDINMPFVSGLQVISASRNSRPQMPIIVLSGYDDFTLVREALLGGVVDYLLKPVNRNDLLSVLEKALALRDVRRAEVEKQAEVREKIQEAASILRDRELSELVSGEAGAVDPRELDLEFEVAFLTPILVKIPEKGDGRRRVEGERFSAKVKAILLEEARGGTSVVFRNVYARGEYVLLVEKDPGSLARLALSIAEKVRGRTGAEPLVAVGRECYSFERLGSAYREARAALLTLPAAGGRPVSVKDIPRAASRRRVGGEQENRLAVAIQSRNRALAGSVVFDDIGLASCEDWPLIDVKQTAEYIFRLLFQRSDGQTLSSLEAEDLTALLDMALEGRDLGELRSVLEQALDELVADTQLGQMSDSMKTIVREVKEHIEKNYFANISLMTLAERYHVEKSYLSKAFKQLTGTNLMSAIATTRIEAAARYIERGDVSLSEIAEMVGYDEYAYFNRVFRKIRGVSPSEYRATVRQGRKADA